MKHFVVLGSVSVFMSVCAFVRDLFLSVHMSINLNDSITTKYKKALWHSVYSFSNLNNTLKTLDKSSAHGRWVETKGE